MPTSVSKLDGTAAAALARTRTGDPDPGVVHRLEGRVTAARRCRTECVVDCPLSVATEWYDGAIDRQSTAFRRPTTETDLLDQGARYGDSRLNTGRNP